ncbi:MAG: hypothetical protein VW499_07065 [Candidatus Puniceispirillum sp.]
MVTAEPAMRLWLSLALLLIGLIGSLPDHASAHEIRPAVADLTISTTAPATVTVSIDFTAETFLAGLDASQIKDTDQAPQSADYDALRAMPADALAARFTAAFADFTAGLVGRADNAPLTFSLGALKLVKNMIGHCHHHNHSIWLGRETWTIGFAPAGRWRCRGKPLYRLSGARPAIGADCGHRTNTTNQF